MQAKKVEELDASRRRLEKLLSTYMLPVTVQQWEQWLHDCLPEFRGLMATAPGERRLLSMRLGARVGMPAAVRRMQPLQAKNDGVTADWACNLKLRTGWFVGKTRSHGNLFVFLMVLHNVTHYIDLENEAEGDRKPKCRLDLVCIASLIHELSHLEALLADDVVHAVYELIVTGVAGWAHGVLIKAGAKCSLITEPVPQPKRSNANDDGEEEEVDPSIGACDELSLIHISEPTRPY